MTANRQKVLAALLAAPSVAAAAPAAGLSRETVHPFLRDPTFRAELDRRRDEAFQLALGRVRVLSGRAVEALRRALRHPSPPGRRSPRRRPTP
ncbi:MAG TPA: hypothetical protein VM597_04720 [Gemmataceae bacterium]|nr:hypothetical protein [Gemmataceae bacterium]